MMLEAFKKCYEKNVFSEAYKCHVQFQTIKINYHILLPAYRFPILMQTTKNLIADFILAVLLTFNTWSKKKSNRNGENYVYYW